MQGRLGRLGVVSLIFLESIDEEGMSALEI